MKTNAATGAACLCVLSAFLISAGCSHAPQEPALSPAAQQQSVEEKVKQVQDDPKMPDKVKAAVIANLRGPGGQPPKP